MDGCPRLLAEKPPALELPALMIDEMAIVSLTGVVLWVWASPELAGKPLGLERSTNELFSSVLLHEAGLRKDHYDTKTCRLKWHRCDERNVVLVASYDLELARAHDFSYVDGVLATTAKVLVDQLSEPVGALT